MGMSSSQARLLTLTARMHDIEWRSQKIEADKLRLANDSRHAYEDYLRVLDAKKIQYKTLTQDGVITFRDATCNILQNGIIPGYASEHANDILFLQSNDGKVMVTETVANEFGLTASAVSMTMDEYLEDLGFTRTKEVKVPVEKPDPGTVKTYTVYPNTNETAPVSSISHSGYENYVKNVEDGKFDVSELTGYAQFDPAHSSPSSAPEITGSTTSLPGTDYTIKTAEGLYKFMELTSSGSGCSANITITSDIDMSTIDMSGWSGIKNYTGHFNGNGYTISNITGSNGLFASTAGGAVIENVAVTVGTAGINGGSDVGALIGSADDTDVTNCCATEGKVSGTTDVGGLIGKFNSPGGSDSIIRKVYSTCDVSGSSKLGGLIGYYNVGYTHSNPRSNPTFENTFATGDVTGTSEIGGLVGYFYSDPDKGVSGGSNSYNTDVKNCFSGGKLTGTSSVGGFVGKLSCYDDYEDHFRFIKIDTCAKIVNTGVTSAGIFVGTNAAVTATTVSDFQNSSFGQGINPVLETEPKRLVGEVPSGSASINPSSVSAMSVAGRIPDVTDAYISNIEAVLIKAEKYDPCHPDAPANTQSDMRAKITAFLNKFGDNTTDNTKLWFLNEAIGEYLTDSGASDLGEKLYQDVMNTTTSNTASYQTGSMVGNVKRGGGDFWNVSGTHNVSNGSIDIPSVKTIADELWGMMKKNDKTITITAADVESWMASHYPTTSAPYDSQTAEEKQIRISLANINDKIANGGNLTALTNAILAGSGSSRVDYSDKWADGYNGGKWSVNIGADQTVTYTPDTKIEMETDHYEWDTEDPAIANAMAMWVIAQRGIEIIEEPDASSYTYLKNVLELRAAVLTTFDPAGAVALQGMPAADILAMDEDEYNQRMGIVNTSVSVRTSVQEVQDEKDLRKAEADYEAKMRQIDRKDRQYDTQLAACESERNAIKQEMDTLKTVAKDNVDRTFKLFS